jgi:hypothetical protein
MEDKMEGQTKVKKFIAHKNQKREKASPFRGKKLFRP